LIILITGGPDNAGRPLLARCNRFFPAHGRSGQRLRQAQETGVTMYIIGSVIVVLLLVYLTAVPLGPEDFS
jgi:hypothetical protein